MMSRWSRLWRNLVHRDRVEHDLDDELHATFELLVDEQIKAGVPADAARRAAALQLGNIEPLKERVRDVRAGAATEAMLQDVRYALRLLRRSPGFTAVALLTLALGIGANTTMFSIVHGVLLRPLPYTDADRLVHLYLANPEQGITDGMVSPPDFEQWQSATRSFSSMGAYGAGPATLTQPGDATEIDIAWTMGGFFETLGTPARLGRVLDADDMQKAAPHAVISERLWMTRFGGDPAVLGQAIVLLGRAYTVVGVMPAEFHYPTPATDAWTVRSVLSEMEIGPNNRHQRVLQTIARLQSGTSIEQARAELTAFAAQLATQFPDTNTGWNMATVVPLRTSIVGDVDSALIVVLLMVGVTLLIGCVNLANLMLARGPARAGEIAIRTALGAGRLRIVRQILTESVVLALLGGAIGIALSFWGVQAILALSADTLPRVDDVRVDGRVIAFGVLLALLTGSLFGVLPALRAARAEPQTHLRGGRGTVGHGHRVRDALVIAEVSLAVVLVIGAVLMTRSFVALRSVNPGFDPEQVLTVSMMINISGAKDVIGHIVSRRREFLQRIAAMPGVADVGAVNILPLQPGVWEWFEFTRADGTGMPDGSQLRADRTYVDGGYLRAMSIPLLRGEPLPRDRSQLAPGAPLPFLISETGARRFWPTEEAVGQLVRAPWGTGIVAGVVGDVRHLGLAQPPIPAVYFPHFVGPRVVTTLVARTDGDPAALAGAVRQAIRDIDPNQPIRSIAPLGAVMAESIARDRFFTVVFVVFGGLALVLAAIGVYGVLAYSVGQRTQEIGVRMALGARAADILQMVMGGGMRLVLAGVVLGTIAAVFLTRAISSQLYGVSPTDALTFIIAPAGLAVVALAACYVPARRAVRIQPVTALREG
ncbi:MAG TPA: ABC transporter permease [Vicinamibacterales bacterium]|nr:ABC transporter permease [Vicinamibacterales bacterium]